MSTTESETVIPSGEVLRGLLHQLHGVDRGEQLFAEAENNRERDAKFAQLQKDIASTRGFIGAEIRAARERLVEAQHAAHAAEAARTAANRALEDAGIQLQQAKDRLDRELQALHDEFRGGPAPSPHARQWSGAPSWFQPTPEAPSEQAAAVASEKLTAEELRLKNEKEWAATLMRPAG